jgi:hypothetical protein
LVPVIEAVNPTLPPSQIVALGGVIVGIAGLVFTRTVVVTVADGHPAADVAVKLYEPVAAVVTEEMLGFCEADVNEFGPVHAKVVPILVVPVRFNVVPTQTGVFEEADAVGVGDIVNDTTLEYEVTEPAEHVTASR